MLAQTCRVSRRTCLGAGRFSIARRPVPRRSTVGSRKLPTMLTQSPDGRCFFELADGAAAYAGGPEPGAGKLICGGARSIIVAAGCLFELSPIRPSRLRRRARPRCLLPSRPPGETDRFPRATRSTPDAPHPRSPRSTPTHSGSPGCRAGWRRPRCPCPVQAPGNELGQQHTYPVSDLGMVGRDVHQHTEQRRHACGAGLGAHPVLDGVDGRQSVFLEQQR